MKCEKCVEAGLKSNVYIGASMSTCMAWQPYYDADGVYHSDDPNIHTTNYSCSNGHRWSVRTQHGVTSLLHSEPPAPSPSTQEKP